ncbi:hypothetical protein E2986_12015 [Frieseomelitta varia]|uniref:Uncharacterized protein n=1 Tax=Frieseomelitta varia TaxID=561572 RepID=A0A833RMS3_9HYME|nr:hypothetical protein E2986_12015 [Frieseomelitta varia]
MILITFIQISLLTCDKKYIRVYKSIHIYPLFRFSVQSVQTNHYEVLAVTIHLINALLREQVKSNLRLIIYGEVITGKLHLSSFDQNKKIDQKCVSADLTSETIIDNVKNCLKWALLNIDILNNLCLRSVNGIERLLIHNVDLPGITNSLINIIYSIILGEIYTKYYKSVSMIIGNLYKTKYYDDVNKPLAILQKSFTQLHVNKDTFHEIRDYLTLYKLLESILPYIIHFCCTKLCPVKKPKELFRNYKNSNIFTVNEEMRLQNLQILRKFQNWDNFNIWISSNNVSKLIVVRSMLMAQENIFKYSDILEKHLSLSDW